MNYSSSKEPAPTVGDVRYGFLQRGREIAYAKVKLETPNEVEAFEQKALDERCNASYRVFLNLKVTRLAESC